MGGSGNVGIWFGPRFKLSAFIETRRSASLRGLAIGGWAATVDSGGRLLWCSVVVKALTPPLDALDCRLVVLLLVGELRSGLLFKLPLGSKY